MAVFILLLVCGIQSSVGALAATSFSIQQIPYISSNSNISMNRDDKGRLYYYGSREMDCKEIKKLSDYKASPKIKKQIKAEGKKKFSDKYWYTVDKYTAGKNGKVKCSTIICENDIMYAKKFQNQNNETTMAYIKGKKVIIDTYNSKAERIFHFVDKVKKSKNEYIGTTCVYENAKYIYYLYTKSDINTIQRSCYINCISKKTGKLLSSKKIYNTGGIGAFNDTIVKIVDGKVYMIQEKKIVSYSLKGKRISEYGIPEETTNSTDMANGDSIASRLTFKKYDVYGDYIYFCNANGVYRCSITGNGGFLLFYDASTDENFSEKYGLVDMKVTNDNMFYLLLIDESSVDEGIPTKLVKYTKNKSIQKSCMSS